MDPSVVILDVRVETFLMTVVQWKICEQRERRDPTVIRGMRVKDRI